MSEQLKAKYAIATPHEDIRKGRPAESAFAANLQAVVQGTAPRVDLDPEEFYRNLYDHHSLNDPAPCGQCASWDAEAGVHTISV